MDTVFQPIHDAFSTQQHLQDAEFEFRFGKINNTFFDTNVGEELFHKILRGLEKYKGWEDVRQIRTSVYSKDDIRMIINEDTEEETFMKKKNIFKNNFNLSQKVLDFRFSLSTETSIPSLESEDQVMDTVRTKNRTSFIRKNLSIDMTIVTGDPSDLDCEEEARYEIELEIIDPKNVKDKNELFNLVQKVFDVLKIVE
jgi:hypothetical protein